jgi:alkylation response protein AidB-like acyl-CoA dehydrogenase
MNQSAYIQQNEELRAFNDLACSFARKELLEHVHEHEYPYRREVTGVMKMAIEAGLFGINLSADWGGTGLDASALAGIMEEISAVDAGMAAMLFTNTAALEIIAAAALPGDEPRQSLVRYALPEKVRTGLVLTGTPEEKAGRLTRILGEKGLLT